MWLDNQKAITDKQDIPIQWNTFAAGGSNSVILITQATWPNSAYDITANWDPVWVLMHNEGCFVMSPSTTKIRLSIPSPDASRSFGSIGGDP